MRQRAVVDVFVSLLFLYLIYDRQDRLHLYENYFQKGVLASSWSIGELARHFRCAPNTIRKHIQELETTGCIKIVKVPGKDAWDGQEHQIYILGNHDGQKSEAFFIDDVFGGTAIPDGQVVQ